MPTQKHVEQVCALFLAESKGETIQTSFNTSGASWKDSSAIHNAHLAMQSPECFRIKPTPATFWLVRYRDGSVNVMRDEHEANYEAKHCSGSVIIRTQEVL